jgi:hypothetical protein
VLARVIGLQTNCKPDFHELFCSAARAK